MDNELNQLRQEVKFDLQRMSAELAAMYKELARLRWQSCMRRMHSQTMAWAAGHSPYPKAMAKLAEQSSLALQAQPYNHHAASEALDKFEAAMDRLSAFTPSPKF